MRLIVAPSGVRAAARRSGLWTRNRWPGAGLRHDAPVSGNLGSSGAPATAPAGRRAWPDRDGAIRACGSASLIVAVSVVAGARLLASADDTVAVWAAAADMGAGDTVAADDLVARRVRFGDDRRPRALLRRRRRRCRPDLQLTRGVGAGELLPRAAVGPAASRRAGAAAGCRRRRAGAAVGRRRARWSMSTCCRSGGGAARPGARPCSRPRRWSSASSARRELRRVAATGSWCSASPSDAAGAWFEAYGATAAPTVTVVRRGGSGGPDCRRPHGRRRAPPGSPGTGRARRAPRRRRAQALRRRRRPARRRRPRARPTSPSLGSRRARARPDGGRPPPAVTGAPGGCRRPPGRPTGRLRADPDRASARPVADDRSVDLPVVVRAADDVAAVAPGRADLPEAHVPPETGGGRVIAVWGPGRRARPHHGGGGRRRPSSRARRSPDHPGRRRPLRRRGRPAARRPRRGLRAARGGPARGERPAARPVRDRAARARRPPPVVTGLPRPDRWARSGRDRSSACSRSRRRQADVVVDTGFCLEDDPAADLGCPARSATRLPSRRSAAADERGGGRLGRPGRARPGWPAGWPSCARSCPALGRGWSSTGCARPWAGPRRTSPAWSTGFARMAGLHFLPDDRAAVDRALVGGRTLVEAGDSALRRVGRRSGRRGRS